MDLKSKKIFVKELFLLFGLIVFCFLLEREFFDFGHLILGSKHFQGKTLWIYKPVPLTLDFFTFTPLYAVYLIRIIYWFLKVTRKKI